MGKRGPKPTPLAELIFWEGLWYWVFHHLRGTLPTATRFSANRKMKKFLRAELQELRKLVPKDNVESDWLNREKADIERELRPKMPTSEPEVWKALVAAASADKVRAACGLSKRWLNPKWQGRVFVQDLFDHAGDFINAKQDAYYPKRDSGDEKRVIFFARAMAGISLGISPHTSLDRLRKLAHGKKCPCISCDLLRWERIDRYRDKFWFRSSS